jgi:hypothetical protein
MDAPTQAAPQELPRLDKNPIAPAVAAALAAAQGRRDQIQADVNSLALAEFEGDAASKAKRIELEAELDELDAEVLRLTHARAQALAADERAANERRVARIEQQMPAFERALQARLDAAARLDAGAREYALGWEALLDATAALERAMPGGTVPPGGFRFDALPVRQAQAAIYRHSRISAISGRPRIPPGSHPENEMKAYQPLANAALTTVIATENESIKQSVRRQVLAHRKHLLGEQS